MQRFLISMLALYMVAVCAVSADASVAKKSVSLIRKTSDAVGNAIWNNKGSIAIGTAAVAVATEPEILVQPFVGNTGQAVSGQSITLVRIIFYLLVVVLAIIGMRVIFLYIKHWLSFWKIVLLMMISILFCCSGIAQAGVMEGGVIRLPWWDALGWIILLLTMFVVG